MMSKRMRVNRGWGLITMSVAAIAALAAIVPGSGQGARGVNIYDPGDIIVADSVHQTVKAVDPVTGAASQITNAAFAAPYDVTFADDGDIFVVDRDAFGGTGGIRRLESTTGAQTAVTSNDLSAAAGGKELMRNPVALDRKGDSLFVADYSPPRKIIEVDIATGKQSLVTKAGALQSPFGIIDAEGANLLVSDASAFHNNNERGAVIEVNANTGKQTALSKKGKFVFPQNLALLGSKNVLVTDTDTFQKPGVVFKVNLKTGAQKTLAKGLPLHSPGGIALIDNDTAAVADYYAPSGSGGIYSVDLDTGDQTLLNGTDLSNPSGIRIAP
jgi:hypothetical protein